MEGGIPDAAPSAFRECFSLSFKNLIIYAGTILLVAISISILVFGPKPCLFRRPPLLSPAQFFFSRFFPFCWAGSFLSRNPLSRTRCFFFPYTILRNTYPVSDHHLFPLPANSAFGGLSVTDRRLFTFTLFVLFMVCCSLTEAGYISYNATFVIIPGIFCSECFGFGCLGSSSR